VSVAVALPAPRALRAAHVTVVVAWALFSGFTSGLVLCVSAPRLVGVRAFTELTGSMRPVLQPGDVVLVKDMKAGMAVAGQVITFRDPKGGDRLITHRVRTVSVDKGIVSFVTRGDANNADEEWQLRPDGQIGVVTNRIPLLGYGLQYLSGRQAPLLLITLPSLLLGALELRRIWRKR